MKTPWVLVPTLSLLRSGCALFLRPGGQIVMPEAREATPPEILFDSAADPRLPGPDGGLELHDPAPLPNHRFYRRVVE